MEIKRFIFEGNGKEVVKVTNGRFTAYIAASIPFEVIEIWRRRVRRRLKHESRLKFRVRVGKRPRSKPERVRPRRQRPQKKRYHARRRYWTDAPGQKRR